MSETANAAGGGVPLNISIHVSSAATLAAIDALAAAEGCKRPKAAVLLIERALAAAPPPASGEALVNLEAVSTDNIVDELVGRLQRVGELEAAEARAASAEAKLLAVASAIGGAAP